MTSTRRDFLKSTTKTAIGTGMFLGAIDNSFTSLFGKNPVSPPNILFIFADQMRNRSWSHYDSFIHTPNLNRLASEGMTFDNCISTSPLCSPFRAMLFTGRYPRAQGILHNDIPLPDTETTIAQILKARGYRTGYVGKWHLSGGREEYPKRSWVPAEMRFGFEDFWKVIEVQHAYRVSSPKPYYYDENNTRVSLNMFQTTGEANLVIDFIRDHKQNNSESPFFMCWSPSPPHSPYNQYPTSQTWYSQDGSNNFTDIPWLKNAPLNNQTQSRMNAIGGYYSLISQIDQDIGSVLDELDKPEYASIKDNTIVVFTSDHGDMLYSQGKTKKLQPWEESINVPFIIRYPDVIQPNQTTDALMGTIDIMPTLLGLANLSSLIPSNVHGKNLSFIMRRESGNEQDAVFLTVPKLKKPFADVSKWAGVRTKAAVYATFEEGVEGYNGGTHGGYIMYDLVNDPYELNNLVDLPEHVLMQEELWDLLHILIKEAGEAPFFNMTP